MTFAANYSLIGIIRVLDLVIVDILNVLIRNVKKPLMR